MIYLCGSASAVQKFVREKQLQPGTYVHVQSPLDLETGKTRKHKPMEIYHCGKQYWLSPGWQEIYNWILACPIWVRVRHDHEWGKP